MKATSPSSLNCLKTEHFKAWSTKQKAYTHVKVNGYRAALEAAEMCKVLVDAHMIPIWNWSDAVVANAKVHDVLLLVTGTDALGIVEGMPNQGFEAWRLFKGRYSSVGEM